MIVTPLMPVKDKPPDWLLDWQAASSLDEACLGYAGHIFLGDIASL